MSSQTAKGFEGDGVAETEELHEKHRAEFASIDDALLAMARGEFVVVLDDEDRENEGDLIIAADKMTPEAMGFMVKHTSGLVCVAMEPERCEQLQLPLMVSNQSNEDKMLTAYTISCDHKSTSTGISAADRTLTVRALADPNTKVTDLQRPGHVFPLRYRPGGVLKRAGHTEAAVDLARLAGCAPLGVICEIVNEDGSMSRTPELLEFARTHNLLCITIDELIEYRARNERLVEVVAEETLPTAHGEFTVKSFKSVLDGTEHLALIMGEVGEGKDILVRVHSECLTGDLFGSARCDCGSQLQSALAQVSEAGRGVVVYLRGGEGKGVGLSHQLRTYNMSEEEEEEPPLTPPVGTPIDSREYGIGAQILQDLGVHTMRLMTNNPNPYHGLKGYGLEVLERVPLTTAPRINIKINGTSSIQRPSR